MFKLYSLLFLTIFIYITNASCQEEVWQTYNENNNLYNNVMLHKHHQSKNNEDWKLQELDKLNEVTNDLILPNSILNNANDNTVDTLNIKKIVTTNNQSDQLLKQQNDDSSLFISETQLILGTTRSNVQMSIDNEVQPKFLLGTQTQSAPGSPKSNMKDIHQKFSFKTKIQPNRPTSNDITLKIFGTRMQPIPETQNQNNNAKIDSQCTQHNRRNSNCIAWRNPNTIKQFTKQNKINNHYEHKHNKRQ